MREVYHGQLSQLAEQLGSMCRMVAEAMALATKALLDANLGLAEQIISEDAKVDEARANCEEQAFSLLALQAPVATDLRSVLAAVHVADDLERMGDLALHVAKATRRRHPQTVLPELVRDDFAKMGRVAVALAMRAERVILEQDVEEARALEHADDEMDELHRHLFTVLMGPEWPHGVATAVDLTLLGRFYERFADHAVSVARRTIFIVTGTMPGSEG
jgi:phosphate transport system protein